MSTTAELRTPVAGGAPIALPMDAFSSGWLSGGIAILQANGQITSLNEALRTWLIANGSDRALTESFWSSLSSLHPGWQQAMEEVLAQSEPFARLELPWHERQRIGLEIARHQGLTFVRLESLLPPSEEFDERVAEDALEKPAAWRQLLSRWRRVEDQLNNLVRRWPGVIFSQRPDLSFHYASEKIEELTGVPVEEWKQIPQRFWQVVHEADVDEVRQRLRRSSEAEVPSVFRIRNLRTGRVAYVAEYRQAVRTQRGLLLGFEGVWLDVTRQSVAEKRLSSAAWKDTLSVLTMGLAHDFSNIIAGIHSLSEAFQAEIGPEHPFQEGLRLIKANSMQASQLVHRILQLHHGKVGERNYHNLNEMVREIVDLVRKIVPRGVRLEAEIGSESLPVYADSVEFRQVLINLARNAVDAMPQGGRLRITVSRHESYPPLGYVQGQLPKLPSLCVSTEDEGCGIPAQHLHSIFDPFFTTKSAEKGSGLGLYNARLFAEKHHGAISVDSVEKQGTVLRLWLPEADFTESERVETAPNPPRHTFLLFGRAGDVLDSTAEFLRRNGLPVVTASPPENASGLLQGEAYSLAGVFLMVHGADPSYRELAAATRRTSRPIKLIVQASGCNQDELDADLLKQADLVLPAELTRAAMLASVNSLFTPESP